MIKIFNHFIPRIASILFLTEILVLLGSPYLAASLRFTDPEYQFVREIPNFGPSAIAYALAISFSMAVFGMYHLSSRQGVYDSLHRLPPAFVLGVLLIALFYYAFPEIYLGRGVLALSVLLGAIGVPLIRLLVLRFFKFRMLKSCVVFIGDVNLASQCMELSGIANFHDRFEIAGFIPLASGSDYRTGSIFPSDMSLIHIARQYNVSEIVIAVKNWRGINIPIQQLLECRINGVAVTNISRFFERETNKINVNYLQPSWLVFGEGFNQGVWRTVAKRIVDLTAGSLLLALTLPVMLLTILAIRLEDRGPILYRQERVGKSGKTFMVLKFRSMRTDAEQAGGPQWARAGDPRITRVGRFIRKTRIDELPQIINVLKGEMSFVGPRPERPYFVKQLCEQIPFYDIRHSIKPGLTGFAQVRYQYGATVEDAVEKLQYDLYYLKNHSLFLDLLIIMDTFQVVLFAKGSR